MKKETESIDKFCKRNSLSLCVKPTITGEDFTKARDKALLTACLVWNAIDKSGRYRIKLPDAAGSGCDIQLAKAQAENANDGAGSDSESESDAESTE